MELLESVGSEITRYNFLYIYFNLLISVLTRCQPDAPFKCEMGDLAGKHGNLVIREAPNNGRLFYVDEQLALTGINSINGL